MDTPLGPPAFRGTRRLAHGRGAVRRDVGRDEPAVGGGNDAKTQRHVPQAISRATFHEDLHLALGQATVPDFSEYYGLLDPFPGIVLAEGRAMAVFQGGAPVPLSRIRCRNLADWRQPSGDLVGIDVSTGRIALGPAAVAAGPVTVTRMLSLATIEERINEVLEHKRELFAQIIGENSAPASLGLSQSEIFGLFNLRTPKGAIKPAA